MYIKFDKSVDDWPIQETGTNWSKTGNINIMLRQDIELHQHGSSEWIYWAMPAWLTKTTTKKTKATNNNFGGMRGNLKMTWSGRWVYIRGRKASRLQTHSHKHKTILVLKMSKKIYKSYLKSHWWLNTSKDKHRLNKNRK